MLKVQIYSLLVSISSNTSKVSDMLVTLKIHANLHTLLLPSSGSGLILSPGSVNWHYLMALIIGVASLNSVALTLRAFTGSVALRGAPFYRFRRFSRVSRTSREGEKKRAARESYTTCTSIECDKARMKLDMRGIPSSEKGTW